MIINPIKEDFGMEREYDKTEAIPCHMAEYKRLEAFLEQMARSGYLIHSISPLFNCANFDSALKKNYHICVDLYSKYITTKVFESAEFDEYLDTCQRVGWTAKTCYKNLVIFYSDADERPVDLQTDEALAYELLKTTTFRMESKKVLLNLLLITAFFGYKLWLNQIWMGNHFSEDPFYLFSRTFFDIMLSFWICVDALLLIVNHVRVGHALKHNQPLPQKSTHYTWRIVLYRVMILLIGAYTIFSLYYNRAYLYMGLAVLVFAVNIGVVYCARRWADHLDFSFISLRYKDQVPWIFCTVGYLILWVLGM